MSLPTIALRLDEAVDLGHAWVQALAADRGIRVLFLKGPSLSHHGLRAERVSSDVDILVEPDGFEELCGAIRASGWTARPGDATTRRTTLHSATFLHDRWPCDLDVHRYFPGFLADPAVVFDALWDRHVHLAFAHRTCDVPDRLGALLILGLHSLRGTSAQARHGEELAGVTKTLLSPSEREELASLAVATGCAATLHDVLTSLGVDVSPSIEELTAPGLLEWHDRVTSGSNGTFFWLNVLQTAPWPERPAVLWRAFWPRRDHLRRCVPGR